jgi:RNA recognition motif-containing protein
MFKSEDADFHFCRQSDAIRAIQSMDGQLINGRSMQISQSTAHYVYMCFMLFF